MMEMDYKAVHGVRLKSFLWSDMMYKHLKQKHLEQKGSTQMCYSSDTVMFLILL